LGSVAGEFIAQLFGIVIIGANAGTVQLRAAQNTGAAEDNKVLIDSLLLPRKETA
jgi:hypothetical protein